MLLVNSREIALGPHNVAISDQLCRKSRPTGKFASDASGISIVLERCQTIVVADPRCGSHYRTARTHFKGETQVYTPKVRMVPVEADVWSSTEIMTPECDERHSIGWPDRSQFMKTASNVRSSPVASITTGGECRSSAHKAFSNQPLWLSPCR